MTGTVFGSSSNSSSSGGEETGKDGERDKTEDKLGAGVGEASGEGCSNSKIGAGSSSVPVLLPEVQRVTGEEGEKKIVQVRMNSVCMCQMCICAGLGCSIGRAHTMRVLCHEFVSHSVQLNFFNDRFECGFLLTCLSFFLS